MTLQEIADDAGVAPALVNRYFVSKRALFELVAARARTAWSWDRASFRRELETRIREPFQGMLADDAESEAKIGLPESLIMGFGLFGTGVLVGKENDERFVGDDAIVRRRLARMIKACLDD